jgi:hypothetical protein
MTTKRTMVELVPRRRYSRRRTTNGGKSRVLQFVVASEEQQKKRQTRTKRQFEKIRRMSYDELKASLVRRNLVKQNSDAPLHLLQHIAGGMFIDGLTN